jgi:guanine deaminase
MDTKFLEQAIGMARANVRLKGGPFGALVVKDGIVIATGVNQVTRTNDPTAHAEVVAIREACRALGDFQLRSCDVYCSCEPCPMCVGALFWARPARVYFAATRDDAAAAGFDDSLIYGQIAMDPGERQIPMRHVALKDALAPFEEWRKSAERTEY